MLAVFKRSGLPMGRDANRAILRDSHDALAHEDSFEKNGPGQRKSEADIHSSVKQLR
jgi:hypothetical protein